MHLVALVWQAKAVERGPFCSTSPMTDSATGADSACKMLYNRRQCPGCQNTMPLLYEKRTDVLNMPAEHHPTRLQPQRKPIIVRGDRGDSREE
jgi:hypothetical protein